MEWLVGVFRERKIEVTDPKPSYKMIVFSVCRAAAFGQRLVLLLFKRCSPWSRPSRCRKLLRLQILCNRQTGGSSTDSAWLMLITKNPLHCGNPQHPSWRINWMTFVLPIILKCSGICMLNNLWRVVRNEAFSCDTTPQHTLIDLLVYCSWEKKKRKAFYRSNVIYLWQFLWVASWA